VSASEDVLKIIYRVAIESPQFIASGMGEEQTLGVNLGEDAHRLVECEYKSSAVDKLFGDLERYVRAPGTRVSIVSLAGKARRSLLCSPITEPREIKLTWEATPDEVEKGVGTQVFSLLDAVVDGAIYNREEQTVVLLRSQDEENERQDMAWQAEMRAHSLAEMKRQKLAEEEYEREMKMLRGLLEASPPVKRKKGKKYKGGNGDPFEHFKKAHATKGRPKW